MIELLCLDIDGTMTDGNLYYQMKDGEVIEDIKCFNAKDGLGLVYWHKIGRKSAIITKRDNATKPILEMRAKEVGIDFVFTGVHDKAQCIRDLTKNLGLKKENVASIGDDMNDIPMFAESNLTFAPHDAASHIKRIAHVILHAGGGKGAVREMIEFILKQERLYENFIQSW